MCSKNEISDQFILDYLNGIELGRDTSHIEEWLLSDQNLKHAIRIYEKWELSALISDRPIHITKALSNLKQHIDGKRKAGLSEWGVAHWMAATFVPVIVCFLVWFILNYGEQSDIAFRTSEKTTKIELPDGSSVELYPQSLIRYKSEGFDRGSCREVYLEGTALFQILPSTNPFVVHTRDTHLTLIGKKFEIRSLQNRPTHVRIIDGHVEVRISHPHESFILEPTQQ